MTKTIKAIVVGAALTIGAIGFAPGEANAAGCIKGAMIGGAAGHFAGHHGLLGAAAGCIIGRHSANRREREMYRDRNYTNGYGSSTDPTYTNRYGTDRTYYRNSYDNR